MKTKLLKKLRKQARKHIRIKQTGHRFDIVDTANDYAHCSFQKLQDAIEGLVPLRRYYIKGEIMRLRATRKENYLPY